MPNIYIIAGCNGAGKTTASYTILPEILNCREFVNADEIAKGLSPFQPETVAFEAGRIMLNRIRELMTQQVDFAFETTLSTRSYLNLIDEAKAKDYSIVMLFYWLNSVELAKQRVQERVKQGGHYIPPDVIERRYERGVYNLKNRFIPACDYWMTLDNSTGKSITIAEGDGTAVTLREKILKGTQISFQRLLERTEKEDGYLVISRDGKIVRVKARDLK
jgi:predicted ABC-type ATPase